VSATDIIEEIRKLPAADQQRVLDFLQDICSQRKVDEDGARYASNEEFEKAADKILREHAELFRRLAQ
jgi:hypothetical protein